MSDGEIFIGWHVEMHCADCGWRETVQSPGVNFYWLHVCPGRRSRWERLKAWLFGGRR